MEINGTLLVQAVHFIGAYWLLRVLLFKPALAIISQEQEEQFAAHRSLLEHEQQLEHARNRVDNAWRKCRSYFAEHSPRQNNDKVAFFRGIAPNVASPKIDQKKIKYLAEEAARVIIKEVDHVH